MEAFSRNGSFAPFMPWLQQTTSIGTETEEPDDANLYLECLERLVADAENETMRLRLKLNVSRFLDKKFKENIEEMRQSFDEGADLFMRVIHFNDRMHEHFNHMEKKQVKEAMERLREAIAARYIVH